MSDPSRVSPAAEEAMKTIGLVVATILWVVVIAFVMMGRQP